MIVTKSKFAEMTGRSRQTVSQCALRGTIITTEFGKIDTEDEVNINYMRRAEEERKVKEFNEKEEKRNQEKLSSSESSDSLNSQESQAPEKPRDELSSHASKAKRGQEVLKYQKLELEVQELKGDLVRKDSVSDICFGYLSALNLSILETPQSFLDEFEGAVRNNLSRSDKIKILTRPICDAISHAVKQIEKKLRDSNEN